MMMIHIEKIKYKNSSENLFENESFQLKKGEFTFLKRPSGYGKSTLFRILSALIQENELEIEGTIQNENQSLPLKNWKNQWSQNKEIFFSLMTQQTYLLPWKNVFENIELAFLPQPKNTNKEKIILDYLNLVQLNGFENRLISSLSVGQKARVSLVRTLCQNRRGILLDEPFAALDKELQREIFEILKLEFQSKGNYIFIVSHDK